MALTSCPECGTEVSDQAKQCPKCAYPFREDPSSITVTRGGAKWEGAGFVLMVAGLIIGMAGSGPLGGALFGAGFLIFLVGRFN